MNNVKNTSKMAEWLDFEKELKLQNKKRELIIESEKIVGHKRRLATASILTVLGVLSALAANKVPDETVKSISGAQQKEIIPVQKKTFYAFSVLTCLGSMPFWVLSMRGKHLVDRQMKNRERDS